MVRDIDVLEESEKFERVDQPIFVRDGNVLKLNAMEVSSAEEMLEVFEDNEKVYWNVGGMGMGPHDNVFMATTPDQEIAHTKVNNVFRLLRDFFEANKEALSDVGASEAHGCGFMPQLKNNEDPQSKIQDQVKRVQNMSENDYEPIFALVVKEEDIGSSLQDADYSLVSIGFIKKDGDIYFIAENGDDVSGMVEEYGSDYLKQFV